MTVTRMGGTMMETTEGDRESLSCVRGKQERMQEMEMRAQYERLNRTKSERECDTRPRNVQLRGRR